MIQESAIFQSPNCDSLSLLYLMRTNEVLSEHCLTRTAKPSSGLKADVDSVWKPVYSPIVHAGVLRCSTTEHAPTEVSRTQALAQLCILIQPS